MEKSKLCHEIDCKNVDAKYDRPKKLISIKDLRLPWKPLHDLLVKELFPKKRKAGHT